MHDNQDDHRNTVSPVRTRSPAHFVPGAHPATVGLWPCAHRQHGPAGGWNAERETVPRLQQRGRCLAATPNPFRTRVAVGLHIAPTRVGRSHLQQHQEDCMKTERHTERSLSPYIAGWRSHQLVRRTPPSALRYWTKHAHRLGGCQGGVHACWPSAWRSLPA